MKKKTLISWSSGKDSAWALHLLRQDPGIELLGLFTAMNQKYSRVSMHATRLEMLQQNNTTNNTTINNINININGNKISAGQQPGGASALRHRVCQ